MEEKLRFPNLTWAIDEKRLAHYELATSARMDASRFSRCLRGRFEFAPHEKTRIAELLSYSEAWLFSEPRPPRTTSAIRETETVPAMACLES
jgi:hypothetical protein